MHGNYHYVIRVLRHLYVIVRNIQRYHDMIGVSLATRYGSNGTGITGS